MTRLRVAPRSSERGLRPAVGRDERERAQDRPSPDFEFVSEALEMAESLPPGPVEILVAPGVYREKLRIRRPGLSIIGESEAAVEGLAEARSPASSLRPSARIVWDDGARRALPDGEPMGTFNSYVVYVGAPGVTMRGLEIANEAGDGRVAGQAVALYADADRFVAEGCAILGRQDSLLAGPLPRDPPPRGADLLHPVAGLGADEPALPFRQVYRGCLVEGDVDFVFGSAAALFELCELRSIEREGEPGYIAAPSTYPGQSTGFLFYRCRLTHASGGTAGRLDTGGPPGPAAAWRGSGSVFLGRPWRDHAKAVYARCWMGGHIAREGWDDWGRASARELSLFGELGSIGPGAGAAGCDGGTAGGRCGGRTGGRAHWAKSVSSETVEAMRSEILSFLVRGTRGL
jgi:pectinesterase